MNNNSPLIEQLLQQLQSDNMTVRRAAVRRIRDFPDEIFVEPLIVLLRDESNEIRLSAIKSLGVIKSLKAFESLAALVGDENVNIKASALSALGILQDKRAFEYFAIGLSDSSSDIRRASVRALRKFKDQDCIELLSVALKDSDAGVRRSAIEGLVEIDNVNLNILGEALRDEDVTVRRTVINSSANFHEEDFINLLVFALSDEEPSIRLSAARQITDRLGGTRDAKSAFETLIKLAQSDKDTNVRTQAIAALGRIGDVKAIPYLIPIAQANGIKSERAIAQMALGWIRDKAATEGLIPLLHDEDENVRMNAVEALGKIRDPKAVNHVAILLDDEVGNVRRSAASCLKRIGNKEAFVALATVLPYNSNLVYRILRDWNGELPDGKDKAKYILRDVIANNNSSFPIRSNLIFAAMLPSITEQTEEQFQVERLNLAKTLLEEALFRKNDAKMIAVIADLLCFGMDGRDKAADLVEQYQKDFSIPAPDFELLRKYIGGERALEPILAQLRANLDQHFLEPIDSLNKTTFEMWDDTVKQAKRGFYTRLYMSVIIFALGLVASSIALYQFSFGNIDRAVLFFGPSVTLVVGLASITATFYTGPLREIEKSVVDLGIIHTVFIGYIHTVLEVSQTFAALVLQQKIDFSEMKKSNDLIKDSMAHTLGLLRPELKQKIEKALDEKLSRD